MSDRNIIRDAFSPVLASEETISEVLKMTNTNNTIKFRRSKTTRIVLIAAAAALVLCVGVGAYVGYTQYENPGEMLNAFFGEGESTSGGGIVEYETVVIDGVEYDKLVTNLPRWERVPVDPEVAERLVYPYVLGVGAAGQYEDYTFTVEACVYDAKTGSGLLYFTVENPNGVDGYSVTPDGEILWPNGSEINIVLNGGERSYIDEKQTTDTKVYICAHFCTIEDWGEFALRIVAGGNVVDEIAIELFDSGLPCIELDGGNVKLSPINMEVNMPSVGVDTGSYIREIVIRYADGGEYVVKSEELFTDNTAYGFQHDDGDVTYLFNRIVDIEAVSEIVIEGRVFTAG